MEEDNKSSYLCLLLLLLLLFCNFFVPHLADNKTTIHFFILGDSTVDVGTNNFLTSKAKANFPQYGIDFPNKRATGRFSNGFNGADELAKQFGLKRSPPPFLFLQTLETHRFHQHLYKGGGVNFASAGSGLLDTTGLNVTVVPFSEQIAQFTSVRNNISAMIGETATEKLLCKSLFFISIGSNDVFDYFSTNNTTPADQFISILMSTYSKHITTLHGLGARKFGIIGMPPLGCCPSSRLLNETNCFQPMNDFAENFYLELNTLLFNISSQLPDMKYSLGDANQMTLAVIANPRSFEFDNADSACCGFGTLNAQDRCNATAPVCPDRRKYIFWDKFHPTQRASSLAAQILYNGPVFVTPISFSQLADDN